MNKPENRQYFIECLRHDIEQKVGRSISTPSDFNFLYLELSKVINEAPSISTLKRLWAYVSVSSARSLSTLNSLSRFLGYADWRSYVAQLMRQNRVESSFISTNTILSQNLSPGDCIELTWHPLRRIVAEYLGDNNYVVKQVDSSKLKVGTHFTALIFTKGMPLTVTDVEFEGENLGHYSAGIKNGIQSLRFIPLPKK